MKECFHPIAEEMMLFLDVHRAHRNALMTALANANLKDIGQPRALVLLESLSDGCSTQLELAEALHISPSPMTASLKSLERKGYIERRADVADGRCKRVVITQKGLDAVARVHQAFDAVDKKLFSGFTEEDVRRIRGDYRHMLENLYDIGGKNDAPPPFED